jgi:hypothetical protein
MDDTPRLFSTEFVLKGSARLQLFHGHDDKTLIRRRYHGMANSSVANRNLNMSLSISKKVFMIVQQ